MAIRGSGRTGSKSHLTRGGVVRSGGIPGTLRVGEKDLKMKFGNVPPFHRVDFVKLVFLVF